MVSYPGAFDLEYAVKFLDACIKGFVVDILSPEFPLTRALTTYVLYIRFVKLCINDRTLLPFIERVTAEGGRRENMGLLPLDCLVLYMSE